MSSTNEASARPQPGPTRNLADLRGVGKMTAVQAVKERGGNTVSAFFEANRSAITAVLPKHMTAERMMKIALRSLRLTPKLMDCRMDSLFGAVITCSQLGLEPNTPQGHVYLIPFKDEATVVIGYKGLIDLARRSGQIVSISARVVRKGDDFSIDYGTEERIHHKPMLDGEPGDAIGYYAVAHLRDGGVQFEFMTKAQIERIRSASQGRNSDAWRNHFDEMARKTVIRRLAKFLPMSVELAHAVELDGAAEGGKPQNLASILEGVDYTVQSEDAPNVDEDAPPADDQPAQQDAEAPPASLALVDADANPVSVTATARPKATVEQAWLARFGAELRRLPDPDAIQDWYADNKPHCDVVARHWPEVAADAAKLVVDRAEELDFPGDRPSQPPAGK